jgi:anti-sigma factor RsiW
VKNDCRTIRSELSAYIDNELPSAERTVIDGHVSGCADCQRELENLKSLAAGVAALPTLPVPPRFLAEVRRKIARAENPPERAWWDYLFRPVWLKVPLETVAVVVIVALVMRFEQTASDRLLRREAKKAVEQVDMLTQAGNESGSIKMPLATRPVGGTVTKAPELPAAVVVIHAKEFDVVETGARRLAAQLNGRILPSSGQPRIERGQPARAVLLVELPPENVAAFKSQLLRATEHAKELNRFATAEGSAALSKDAPSRAAATGIGSSATTGEAEPNPVVGGGAEQLAAAAERKAAAVVLEIQVVPPTN